MSKAGYPTCCSAQCIWFREFPDRKPLIWPRWHQSSSRRCGVAVPIRGELASLLATSSAMSETIPPSLVLITIGSVTNISIVALFTGGLLPAFVAALGLVVVAWFRARRDDTGAGTRAPLMLMARTFVIAGPRSDPIRHSRAVIGGVAT